MALRRLGRGVCEYLDHLRVLISYWPTREFTDEEWDEYVAIVAHHERTTPGFSVITWNPLNATPRPEQQQRMSAVARGSSSKVALVMHEKLFGFAASVLAFVNPNIRTFSEADWPGVWTHLGLDRAAQSAVEDALKRLQGAADVA